MKKMEGEICGIFIDYSKNVLATDHFLSLIDRAKKCNVPQALLELNEGGLQNFHSALRLPRDKAPQEVLQVREKMDEFVKFVHSSQFTDIVNIGIGGSDLGPLMAVQALAPYAVTSQKIHFVSTLDAHQITEVLGNLRPEKTLIIISSKSFTTQETLVNAEIFKNWLGDKFLNQAYAVTMNINAAEKFGVRSDNIFPIWDWVGGRYSIWSAIGLPLAIKIGMKNFEEFLLGGHEVDNYILNTPLENNLAVILALLNILYINEYLAQTHAILPYDYRLLHFPRYLQQLEMESNGKPRQGGDTGPIIWGEIGTNGQHSFHQLLHQGTQLVPVDFIICQKPHHKLLDQHLMLVSHCLSQIEALTQHNRLSTLMILPELSPYYLGVLIALYEYKVFISAVIWDINPFDQPGVELGKKIAGEIYQKFKNNELTGLMKKFNDNIP